jgi:hypothetical protein
MKFITSILIIGITAIIFATSSFGKVFNTTYKINADSEIAKSKCMLCHTSPKASAKNLNPYGIDLKNALDANKTKKITSEILKSVENKDSDKDGKTNLDEIKAGTFPGTK